MTGAAHGVFLGLQLFISLKSGSGEVPPTTFDIRMQYSQTATDLRRTIGDKAGVPAEDLILLLGGKEIGGKADEGKTLQDLDIHTGFGIVAIDKRAGNMSALWPPLVEQADGRLMVVPPGPSPREQLLARDDRKEA